VSLLAKWYINHSYAECADAFAGKPAQIEAGLADAIAFGGPLLLTPICLLD